MKHLSKFYRASSLNLVYNQSQLLKAYRFRQDNHHHHQLFRLLHDKGTRNSVTSTSTPPSAKNSRTSDFFQPRFHIKFRHFVAGFTLVSVSSYLLFPDDFNFYFHGFNRGVVAGMTGLIIISDYYLNWPSDQATADSEVLAQREAFKKRIHQRSANRALEAMKFNGGVYIKFGQHLSALGYILPKEWCETMRPLHDACPSTSIEDINQLLQQELGEGVEHLFAYFDPQPIGTASIAQVHQATLRETNQKVAVKVQHPKVHRFAQLDLDTVTWIISLAKWVLPQFQFEWLAEEMNKNMPNEMNFKAEGENADRLKRNFTNSKYAIKVPDVYWSTPKVICMEFIDGFKLNDHRFFLENRIDPNQVSREITKIFSEMIYVHGFVHCDAHPGNLMIRSKPSSPYFEVVVLDHGLYRELSYQFRYHYAKLWLSIIDQDQNQIQANSLALGADANTYKLIASILTGRTWDALKSNAFQSTTSTQAEVELIQGKILELIPDIAALLAAIPRELIFLFKTQDLLKLVHGDLGATEDQKVQYLIMARYCSQLVYRYQRKLHLQTIAKGGFTRWFPAIQHIFLDWVGYWFRSVSLKFYMWALPFLPTLEPKKFIL